MAIQRSWIQSAVKFGIGESYSKQLETTHLPVYGTFGIILYYISGKLYQWTVSPSYDVLEPAHRIFIKLPGIIFDLLICFMIFHIFKKKRGEAAGILAAGIMCFQPALIYDSAIWGQSDSVFTALTLGMLLFLDRKNVVAAGICITLACFSKPQGLLYVPLFIVLLPRNPESIIRSICAVAASALAMIFPLVSTGNIFRLLRGINIGVNNQYTLSVYAYNFWWAIFGSQSLKISTANHLVFSFLTFRNIALTLLDASYAIIVLFLLKKRRDDKEIDIETALLAAGFISYSFFLFYTGTHDRYLFPLIIFGIPLIFGGMRNVILYIGISIAVLLNLFRTLLPFKDSAYIFHSESIGIAVSLALVIFYFRDYLPSMFTWKKFELKYDVSDIRSVASSTQSDVPPIVSVVVSPQQNTEKKPRKIHYISMLEGPFQRLKGASWYFLIPLIFILLFYATLNYHCSTAPECPINLSHQLIGGGGDDFEWFGFMYITKENILGLHHPFADTNIYRYPTGFGYSYGFDGAFAILAGAILGIIFPLIIAYNLTIFLIIAVNIYLSSYYFNKIGKLYSTIPNQLILLKSLLAGIMFGLCPYVLTRLVGHLNLAFVPGFAALAWAFLNHYKKMQERQPINNRDIANYLVAFLLLWLGSPEIIMFGLLLLIPCLVTVTILKWEAAVATSKSIFHSRKELLHLIFWTGIFVSIALYLFGGFFVAAFKHKIFVPWTLSSSIGIRIIALDLLAPKPILGPLWNRFPLLQEQVQSGYWESAFIGLSGIFVLLAYFFSKNTWRQKAIVLLPLIYILTIIAGILPIPLHTPQRLVILLMLILSIVFTVNERFKYWSATALLLILLAERCVFSTRVASPIDLALIPPIENIQGQAIMTVPLIWHDVDDSPQDVLPYFTHKKIVGGYFHWSAYNPSSVETINHSDFDIFRCNKLSRSHDNVLETMKSLGILTISVNKKIGKSWLYNCSAFQKWLEDRIKDKSISLLVEGERLAIYSLN